jgi:hypothetical protein
MRLVQDHVIPCFALEYVGISTGECVRRDADIKSVFVIPSHPKLLSTFGATMVWKNLETREKLLEFHLPIKQHAGRDYDEMRTPNSTITSEMSQ